MSPWEELAPAPLVSLLFGEPASDDEGLLGDAPEAVGDAPEAVGEAAFLAAADWIAFCSLSFAACSAALWSLGFLDLPMLLVELV